MNIFLAPGMDLYRAPMCGRNFEYFGEDPVLSGLTAASLVTGIQSQGVAATIKHFAVNDQEFDRHNLSSDVDQAPFTNCNCVASRSLCAKANPSA